MTRTGHQPQATLGRRLWRAADLACRYAVNLMLAIAIAAVYAA